MSIDTEKAKHVVDSAKILRDALGSKDELSGEFAGRCNELLAVAKEAAPDVPAYRWPPELGAACRRADVVACLDSIKTILGGPDKLIVGRLVR